jgi:hypothetical protein
MLCKKKLRIFYTINLDENIELKNLVWMDVKAKGRDWRYDFICNERCNNNNHSYYKLQQYLDHNLKL